MATNFSFSALHSMYIIPGASVYTLQVGQDIEIDVETLDANALYCIQRDLGSLITSNDDEALVEYLANKTIQAENISAEKIQDLMAATLIGSTYDDEANTIETGGAGGSLEPAGEWDIAASTVIGEIEERPAELVTGYDATVVENSVIPNGFGTYPFIGPYYLYGATTTDDINTDLGIEKWFRVTLTEGVSFKFFAFYGADGITNPINQVVGPLMMDGEPEVSVLFGQMFDEGDGPLVGMVAAVPGESIETVFQPNEINLEGAAYLTVGLITSSNTIIIKNGLGDTYNFNYPPSMFDDSDTFQFIAGGIVGGGFNLPTSVQISYSGAEDEPSMTEITQSIEVAPPEGAQDGQLWVSTSNGEYGGKTVRATESVIFYNDLEDIIVIEHVDVDGAINAELTEDGIITEAVRDIVDTKLAEQGIFTFAGNWNAASHDSGAMNLTAFGGSGYSSYTLYPSGGVELDDVPGRLYTGLNDSVVEFTYEDSNGEEHLPEFDVILPSISADNDIVIEVREESIPLSFPTDKRYISYRFSYVSDGQMECIVKSCDANGTIDEVAIEYIFAPGNRLRFSVRDNLVQMYDPDLYSFGTTYLNFATQSVDVRVMVGKTKPTAPFFFPTQYPGSFIVTNGRRVVSLPALPRDNKTYRVTDADGASFPYNGDRPVKTGDLITFIPENDFLLVRGEDFAMQTRYDEINVNITIDNIDDVIESDIVSINRDTNYVNIAEVTTIYHQSTTDPRVAPIIINFNQDSEGSGNYLGWNYIPGAIYQVVVNTIGGGDIAEIRFENVARDESIIPSVGVVADQKVRFTFAAIHPDGQSYKIIPIARYQEV